MAKYNIPEYLEKIKFANSSNIFDVLSVLSGFRDVGLIELLSNQKFNLEEQLKALEEIVTINSQEYIIKPFEDYNPKKIVHFYLVLNKHAKKKVEDFLQKYRGINITDLSKEFGLLLGYGCCSGTTKEDGYDLPFIPLVACSMECAERWYKEYIRIAKEDCGLKELDLQLRFDQMNVEYINRIEKLGFLEGEPFPLGKYVLKL